ncbi:MAG: bacteriohemerythrin [Spirochaetaceae bacterium]|nr:bacteriohemerythrin [Spirochaetaceae bacterium]
MRYTMDESFLTGYGMVDSQHRQLFDAINALLAACENGSGEDELKKSLDFLTDYTVKHFFDEEQFLKKHGFSGLAAHNQYHETFKKTVADLAHEFILKGVSAALIQAVKDKIGSWLIDHIKGQDFRWVTELKEKHPDLFTAPSLPSAPVSPLSAPPIPAAAILAAAPAPGQRYVMDSSFFTGCELVDAQHGQLFEAINTLIDACENGSGTEELKSSLNFLSDYTVKHFFDEEQMLKKHGFSGMADHNRYHEAFKKTVRDLAHEAILKGVSESLIREVRDKIGNWLVEHIKGQDFRWTKELREKAPELFSAPPARPVHKGPAVANGPASGSGPATGSGQTGKAPVPDTRPAQAAAAGKAPANTAATADPAQKKRGVRIFPAAVSRGSSSIRHKIFSLILILSLASFVGFGIFVYNGGQMQSITRTVTERYHDALAGNAFSEFNGFLDAIEARSGISQDLGETFYMLKDTLSRAELTDIMTAEYHAAFARETALLGGGAFYEPYAFYPGVYDFHYFASKNLAAGTIPPERDVTWAGSEWEWDVDTYAEGWYQIALPAGWNRAIPRENRAYWSELYVDTSVNVLMVSVCLPIYSREKRMVGVATVDVSLATLEEMVASFALPTPSAKIAGFSTINKAVFALSGSAHTGIAPYRANTWLAELGNLKPGDRYENPGFVLDGERYTLIAEVHNSGMGLAFLIPNAEKYEAVDALQRGNQITAIAIAIVMAVIILIVLLALTGWIVRPIRAASEMLQNLARGDLTETITVTGTGELAEMTRLLGQTQEGLRGLVMAISGKAAALTAIGTELQNMMEGAVEVVNRIRSSTEDMKLKSANQAGGVVKTNATMTDIISGIEILNSHIEEQSGSIVQSSSSIEEMIANITSITARLAENEDDLHRLREASSQGNSALQKVSADIQEVSKESERLLEINRVIQSIASQTNLLAMNAAIEAAHAGNVGRGFAVVADEIRKLSESSSAQAKTVSAVLKNIKDALEGISGSTLASLKQFEEIDTGFETVSTQGMSIRASMEQQDAGNKEILSAMEASTGITQKVHTRAVEIQSASRLVINEGKNLEALTGDVTGAINEIAGGIDEINAAIERTSEISRKNRADIGVLLEEISKFRV